MTMLLRDGLPIVVGAGVGAAYYYFVGCRTGGCPITSNLYATTLYGAMMGWLTVGLFR